jgi:hypothetical protein
MSQQMRKSLFDLEPYIGLSEEEMARIQTYVANLSPEEKTKLLAECKQVMQRVEAETRAAFETISLTPSRRM